MLHCARQETLPCTLASLPCVSLAMKTAKHGLASLFCPPTRRSPRPACQSAPRLAGAAAARPSQQPGAQVSNNRVMLSCREQQQRFMLISSNRLSVAQLTVVSHDHPCANACSPTCARSPTFCSHHHHPTYTQRSPTHTFTPHYSVYIYTCVNVYTHTHICTPPMHSRASKGLVLFPRAWVQVMGATCWCAEGMFLTGGVWLQVLTAITDPIEVTDPSGLILFSQCASYQPY